jgi:hypothetical protein
VRNILLDEPSEKVDHDPRVLGAFGIALPKALERIGNTMAQPMKTKRAIAT